MPNGYRECISCDDVLLVPRYSSIMSREDCDTSILEYSLPIISSPMDTVYSKQLDMILLKNQIMTIVHRYFNSCEEQLKSSLMANSTYYRFFAVGSIYGQHKTEWIDKLMGEWGIDKFCIDMAHGDSKACVDTVTYIKNRLNNNGRIIAGNVATKSGFRRLEEAGAWAIRVGLGSGSICSTRGNTGFGVPLLTSVEDCKTVQDTALIIADGGMKNPGDIVKAIAFGADFCMLGRLFAQTDLAPGLCYNKNKELCVEGEKIYFKEYRGMASREARADIMKKASIEGVSGLVPYSGTTEQFIEDLRMNLKAALSYAGCLNWKDFRRNVKKQIISSASLYESQTHID